jgi:hypothetical protein
VLNPFKKAVKVENSGDILSTYHTYRKREKERPHCLLFTGLISAMLRFSRISGPSDIPGNRDPRRDFVVNAPLGFLDQKERQKEKRGSLREYSHLKNVCP